MKQNVTIIPATTLPLVPGRKYLLILPVDAVKDSTLSNAIRTFFGDDTPVFILGAKDVNAIKIAELQEAHEKRG